MGVYEIYQSVSDFIETQLPLEIQAVGGEKSLFLRYDFTSFPRERAEKWFRRGQLPGVGWWVQGMGTQRKYQGLRDWRGTLNIDYLRDLRDGWGVGEGARKVEPASITKAAEENELVLEAAIRVVDQIPFISDTPPKVYAAGEEQGSIISVHDLGALIEELFDAPADVDPPVAGFRISAAIAQRDELEG